MGTHKLWNSVNKPACADPVGQPQLLSMIPPLPPALPLLCVPFPPAGLAFCLWGSWWAYNTAAYYLWASSRRPFRGRTWFPLAGRWLRLLEPLLKLLVPVVAISFELFLDHDMQWQ